MSVKLEMNVHMSVQTLSEATDVPVIKDSDWIQRTEERAIVCINIQLKPHSTPHLGSTLSKGITPFTLIFQNVWLTMYYVQTANLQVIQKACTYLQK